MRNERDKIQDATLYRTGHAESAEEAARTQARLQRIITQMPAGLIETDAHGRITLVNPRLCEMLGYREDELMSKTIWELTAPDCLTETRAIVADLVAGADHAQLEKQYLCKDGTRLQASSTKNALRDASGQFLGISSIVVDISARLQTEAKLRQILDHTNSLIGVLAPDGTLIEINRPALDLGGMSRDVVVGRKFWECFWWSHDPEEVARLKDAVAAAARGELQRYDASVRVSAEGRMAIDFSLSPVLDDDGNVAFLVPSAYDITARKRSEERRAFAMREVNHRSKNLLAVVQSMLRQMQPSDVSDFVRDFGGRLRALSACQDLLVHSPSEKLDLESLIRAQLAYFDADLEQRLQLGGPALDVTPEAAQSLGMAIYELATNAAKYGALLTPEGRVTVGWSISGDDNRRLHLHWRESGGPAVVAPQRRGFGSVVLEDMLAMALSAQTEVRFRQTGLEWWLDSPLEQVTAT
ncbi:PAS domain S-box protein [Natronohydrobacter thiooxidans]|uniref:PAS domain S-box protein n=1 Tax=Natronohydrobacter thiooxidans TaxID=87172 RepID=UPI0008FF0B51|nr:PAS domain S-box protein [Natronohydrobacter thiooxidans]